MPRGTTQALEALTAEDRRVLITRFSHRRAIPEAILAKFAVEVFETEVPTHNERSRSRIFQCAMCHKATTRLRFNGHLHSCKAPKDVWVQYVNANISPIPSQEEHRPTPAPSSSSRATGYVINSRHQAPSGFEGVFDILSDAAAHNTTFSGRVAHISRALTQMSGLIKVIEPMDEFTFASCVPTVPRIFRNARPALARRLGTLAGGNIMDSVTVMAHMYDMATLVQQHERERGFSTPFKFFNSRTGEANAPMEGNTRRLVQLATMNPQLFGTLAGTEDGDPVAISLIMDQSHPLVKNSNQISDEEHDWSVNTESQGSPSIFLAPPTHISSVHVDATVSHHIMYFLSGKKIWIFAPPTAHNFKVLRDMGCPDQYRVEDAITKLNDIHLTTTGPDDILSLPPCWLHGVITGDAPSIHFTSEFDHLPSLQTNTTAILKEVETHANGKAVLDAGFTDEMKTSLNRSSVRRWLGGRKKVQDMVDSLLAMTISENDMEL